MRQNNSNSALESLRLTINSLEARTSAQQRRILDLTAALQGMIGMARIEQKAGSASWGGAADIAESVLLNAAPPQAEEE